MTIRYLIIFISFTVMLTAQEKADTTKPDWKPSGTVGMNVSQIAFSDWSQGGENSLSWSLLGNFGLSYEKTDWKLANQLKLAYGMTKLGDADLRSTDNELFLESVLSYNLGWAINPYFSNTIRTIIVKGYDYKKTPEVQIAAFFDPGYITQSLGFNYVRGKAFNTRLGVAIQETFTNSFRQYSDDPETAGEIESFKFETGIESSTESEFNIEENVLYQGKLRLFTRFNQLDVWDVRWDNVITAKISKYFNVNLNVLIIYEKQQSLRTQIKEALQLGITYTIF